MLVGLAGGGGLAGGRVGLGKGVVGRIWVWHEANGACWLRIDSLDECQYPSDDIDMVYYQCLLTAVTFVRLNTSVQSPGVYGVMKKKQ